MITYILAYMDSNAQPLVNIHVENLTIMITYTIYRLNNYIISYYRNLEYYSVVENQAQLGLVCKLTLRVNRHSNGQESPLCHHYVL